MEIVIPSLSPREFHGEEFYKACIKDYERIRQYRKSLKGKPDVYQQAELTLYKLFEGFYIKLGIKK